MEEFKLVKIEPAFEDERGKIYDLLEMDVKHIGMITSIKGSLRANHYHKLSTQSTYMLKGKIELTIIDLRVENAEPKKVIMTSGDLAIIPPMVVHKYLALEDSEFLDFTTESRLDDGYEKDVYRIKN